MYHILVVEDNFINQKVLSAYLSKDNISLYIAENGIEALNFFETYNFDCILMDIAMPLMDGLEASKRIRKKEKNRRKHTPIIAVTASDPENNKESFYEAGIDDYIAKPINEKMLQKTIQKYCNIIF